MTDAEPDYVVLRSPLLPSRPWIDRTRMHAPAIDFPMLTHDGLRYVRVRWEDCRPTDEFEGDDRGVAQVWEHTPP